MHFSCRSLKLDCPFPKDAHWWWWCSKLTSHLLRVLSPPRWVWEVDFSAHDSVNFFHTVHIIFFFLSYTHFIYLPKTNNNSLENLKVQDSLSFLPAWWRCSRISIFDWQLRVLQKEEGLPLFTNYQTGICVMSRATTTKTCLFSTHIFMPNNPFFFEVVQN